MGSKRKTNIKETMNKQKVKAMKLLIDAMQGATYLIHVASPIPMKDPKDENEIVKPAVDGTLAAMKGAQKHKLKRVVFTSSLEAI